MLGDRLKTERVMVWITLYFVHTSCLSCRNNSITSIDESVTTIESTHTESDDAQPPSLPREALGSRKDPTEPSPGIYGNMTSS